MKYHLNNKSEIGVCKSQKGQCPFAQDEHFTHKEDAQKASEIKLSNELGFINTERKKKDSFKEIKEKLMKDSHEILDAINNDSGWNTTHRRMPKDLNKLKDPTVATNRCLNIAHVIEDYTTFNEAYTGVKMSTVVEQTGKPFLSFHAANLYKDENGEEFVIDYTYSQIDDEADFPHIAKYDDWKEKINNAAVNPKPTIKELLYHNDGRPKLKGVGHSGSAPKVEEFLKELKARAEDSSNPEELRKIYHKTLELSSSYSFIRMSIAKNKNTPVEILKEMTKGDSLIRVYSLETLESLKENNS